MILIATMLASAALQDVPSSATSMAASTTTRTEVVATGSLEIPDELGPSMMPYLRCLMASAGVEMRMNGKKTAPVVEAGGDCSGARKLATTRAEAALKRSGGMSAGARAELIEKTLTSIENFAPKRARPAAGAPSVATEGVRVDSMWQFLGALGYATCLRNHYATVPDAEAEREQRIAQAAKACERSARAPLAKTTLDGGAMPPPFVEAAAQMEKPMAAYLLPMLRALPPSSTPIKERIRFLLAQPDGTRVNLDSGEDNRLEPGSRFVAEVIE